MKDAREHFRRELATFEANKAAWNGGMERWGRGGFLLRQVLLEQEPIVVSHVCLHDSADRR